MLLQKSAGQHGKTARFLPFFVHVCLGQQVVIRGCAPAGSVGCEATTQSGVTGTGCICDTELCNGAVMTSSFGHVIMLVAVLISVVIGYMM